jgi:hypothetical protein
LGAVERGSEGRVGVADCRLFDGTCDHFFTIPAGVIGTNSYAFGLSRH